MEFNLHRKAHNLNPFRYSDLLGEPNERTKESKNGEKKIGRAFIRWLLHFPHMITSSKENNASKKH